MIEIIKDLSKLATPCEPLEFLTNAGPTTEEGKEIIFKLLQVFDENPNIIAVAAPQIGINKRIFCIKFNNVIKTFINPIITKKSKFSIVPEVFSSMPGKEILICRPEEVSVVYYNDEFKYEDNKLLGMAARIFDQMAQLLDGVLPTELGFVSDIAEDGALTDLTEDEFNEAIELYKQFIAQKQAQYQDFVKSDSEIQKQYDHLKLTEAVINDRIKIVEPEIQLSKEQKKNIVVSTAASKNIQQNINRKAFINSKQKRR